MNQETWTAVDGYFQERVLAPDRALQAAVEASERAGLPAIQVTPLQGKLLMLLAQLHGSRSILEIGTLGAYSTIWLARALPEDGKLVTLEVNPKHADVARANLARAGVAERVEIRIGQALDSLAELARQGRGPFDFVFVDADKEHNAEYLEWALKLTGPGSVIVVDNVVRHGAVVDASSRDASVVGTRRFVERLAAEPRVSATAVQIVGSKGYDGMVIARVL